MAEKTRQKINKKEVTIYKQQKRGRMQWKEWRFVSNFPTCIHWMESQSNKCESEKYFYLPKFLVDDTKLEVIADDMFIKCNNKLGSLGDGERA